MQKHGGEDLVPGVPRIGNELGRDQSIFGDEPPDKMIDLHGAASCFHQHLFVVAADPVLNEEEDVCGDQAHRDNRKAFGRIVIFDWNHASSIGDELRAVETDYTISARENLW